MPLKYPHCSRHSCCRIIATQISQNRETVSSVSRDTEGPVVTATRTMTIPNSHKKTIVTGSMRRPNRGYPRVVRFGNTSRDCRRRLFRIPARFPIVTFSNNFPVVLQRIPFRVLVCCPHRKLGC